jgi:hypothetical protein
MILDVESDHYCLICGGVLQAEWEKFRAIAPKFRAARFWQKKNRTHGINGLCFKLRLSSVP